MKKVIILLAVAAVAIGTAAQSTEHIHVFRNDKNFNTHRGSEVTSITFEGTSDEFRTMIVNTTDGQTHSYPMSAIDSCVIRPTAIPEFHVTLTDYPDWTDLKKDATHTKSTEYTATLRMDGNGMYGDIAEQTVTFRGRGNSTWSMPKTPYRFKMAKKASVCGLPKAKSFALIANYIDCSLMRNSVALWLANYLNMPYSNHCVPVKVYLNGHDKGQYMLTEKIGVGGGSVDIDETTGMLFELDSNYDEDYKFKYTFVSSSYKTLPVMVKDPDLAELAADTTVTNITNASQYFAKWQSDFTAMADAVTKRRASESLKDVIDIESVVNFFLVNGIASNHEMKHPKSFYIHKKSLDDGEVYHFGPVWDFDWAFTFDGKEGASATDYMVDKDGDYAGYTFIKLLLSNEEIKALFKERLEEFYTTGYPMLKEYMESYATMIEPTARENGLYWPSNYYTSWCITTSSYEFRTNFETLKKWIDDRLEFMIHDSNFGLYK